MWKSNNCDKILKNTTLVIHDRIVKNSWFEGTENNCIYSVLHKKDKRQISEMLSFYHFAVFLLSLYLFVY